VRHRLAHECRDKVQHPDRDSAIREAARIKRTTGKFSLQVYPCTFHKPGEPRHYHVGTPRKGHRRP
jgi:hypothetical protein